MKFFTNKSIWTKIVIALVIVLLMEFIVAKPSLGADQADVLEFGGKLLAPVVSLAVTLADAVQEIMHSSIMGVGNSLMHINTDSAWYEGLKWVLTAVLVAAVAVAFFMTAGLFTAVVGAVIATIAAKPIVMLGKAVVDSTVDGVRNSIVGYQEGTVPGDFYLPVYSLSPEEIFQGKILLFNVDFFGKPKEIIAMEGQKEGSDEKSVEYYYYKDDDGNEVKTSPQDIGAQLSSTISKWYVSLRYIGIVIMMIVLLYVGIRMLISTVASDKAKYKQMLQDWAMGMVILFSIHYIMVFSNVMVNSLTKVVSSSVAGTTYTAVVQDKGGKIKDFFDEQFGEGNDYIQNIDGKDTLVWPTNLMGRLRIGAQLASWGSEYIGLALCFIVLVIFTAFFVFTYLKRVIYMAFLTLMAPLVAVTYPIDKLNDGQAQGFNKWFKEYIFNLLIQPLHLLLYYILVTSAFELAGSNIIYSLVAIGFMIPAEKLLRSFFGFEKSATAPSALTGAALTTGMMQLMRPKPPKGAGGKDKKSIGDDSAESGGKVPSLSTPKLVESWTAEENEEQEKLNAEKAKLDKEMKEWEEKQQKLEGRRSERIQGEVRGNKPSKLKLARNKMGRYTRSKLAHTAARYKQDLKNAPGNALRMTGKAFVGGAGAALGLATGVAQGDLGKTMASTVAGATLGGAMGNGFVSGGAAKIDQMINSKLPSETPEEAQNRVYNSRRYEELQQHEQLKALKREMKETLKRNDITRSNNKEKYEEWMRDGGLCDQYAGEKIEDTKLMLAAQTAKENGQVNTQQEAIMYAKVAKDLANDPQAKGVNRKKHEEDYIDRLKKKNLSEEVSKTQGTRMVQIGNDINDIRKKIK